ncbi:hypothetical protein [Chryseobacterium sp. JUb7]|uniref:hypothetical protein n=1 Tax=Chryseobacterium sp. JUb7 TaxID=2940599 RepID=UPI002168BB34|nr:hypothetical protein [Chryseobacterium sp. JUb7]MCS3530647.1 hypothetical protein [Chryseobacterium sp. JUb7]
MKKLILIAFTTLLFSSCHQNDWVADSPSSSELSKRESHCGEYLTASMSLVTTVSGQITSNTTWSGVIELDGVVTVKDGATLTILPGTFIKGKPNFNNDPKGVLVIAKTGRINAAGTENQPIIFTSYALLDGNEDTWATSGDFGGVVILGDAPVNQDAGMPIEGLSGPDYYFGGNNPGHNAGTLKYVRIEHAGYDLVGGNSGNEINGLTLGGVGFGTTLNHIQVSYALDDSFEFFGGTVNASNLISFAPTDDNFDFDRGYTGTINCALALADHNSDHSMNNGFVSDTNGIEIDNNAGGTVTSLITKPTINNLTIIGSGTNITSTWGSVYENGIHIRRNGKLILNDAVITGYPTGIRVEGTGSELSSLNYNSIKVHGFTTSVIGFGTSGIPISNLIVSSVATSFGMVQPFYNSGAWNVSPRNCGDFQGVWTKYDCYVE